MGGSKRDSDQHEPDKAPWRQEFDSLPLWAQKMVRALSSPSGWGIGVREALEIHGNKPGQQAFHLILRDDVLQEWVEGFCEMSQLASALTAPWPPPAPPAREKRRLNVVELAADYDHRGFDQPCCFGHRVETRAVYCHNEAWADSPRKCYRNRDDRRHEDCPGFVANPDYDSPTAA